ncbi:hypothetical protein [Trichormus azollae]
MLLVDDIYTTDAIGESAVYTVHQSSISVLGLAAVATNSSQ